MRSTHHSGPAIANSATTIKKNSTLIVVSALLLFFLTYIFLVNRETDIASFGILLSRFLTSFGQGEILELRTVFDAFFGVLIPLAIVTSWIGLGGIIQRLIHHTPENFTLLICWRAGIGACAWSLLWFGLGVAKFYQGTVAVCLIIAGLLLSVIEAHKSWREYKAQNIIPTKNDALEKVLIGLIGLPILLCFIAALAPVTGKDALVYRLAVPQAYIAAGGIIDMPFNVYSYLSFGAEMHGVWALLLGKFFNSQVAEAAFSLVAFSFFPLLITSVYGTARAWQLEKKWALIAACAVAAIPSLYQVASSGYVDHTLAFFILLATQAAGKWWNEQNRAHMILLAIALGAALAVKFIALFCFFAIAFLVLLKVRDAQQNSGFSIKQIFFGGFGALVGGGLLAIPWYFRLWVRTGSPLVPFYAHLWNGKMSGWDAERSRLFQFWVSQYGGAEKGIFDYLFAIVKISLLGQLENSALFDGVIGITMLLGLPLLFWRSKEKLLAIEAKIAVGISGIWFFMWLFTSQQLRFLLPALPLLILAIMAKAENCSQEKSKALQWILSLSALPGLLVIGSWFLEQNPLRVVLGGEAREAYLARRLEFYPYYQIINHELPATAKIWLINMRNDTVHLERSFVADYIFEDYTLTEFVKTAENAQQLSDKVKLLGVTHILMRHDVLLDYARTPIVDEKKSEAENQAKLSLLKEFLRQGTTVIKRDEKYLLIAL